MLQVECRHPSLDALSTEALTTPTPPPDYLNGYLCSTSLKLLPKLMYTVRH